MSGNLEQLYKKRRRKRSRNNGTVALVVIFVMLFAIVTTVVACNYIGGDESSDAESSVVESIASTPEESSKPDESAPYEPYIVSTASVGVSGDILMHGPVLNSAKAASTVAGEYDFTKMFADIKPYYEKYDFMIANLEVTLGGTAAGAYKGYPTFNCPDSIVDALLGAGVDMMLTANNHSFDTGYNGFIRTQEVLNEKGMSYIGTKLTEDAKNYTVQDINGIKIGMVCYTYETSGKNDTYKSLNGIPLGKKGSPLVSSFNRNRLDELYQNVEATLANMKADGAEATMIFIHWGEEYLLNPTNEQKTIAQELCNLGVDVIVGGHPHVVEPFETLTSESGHKTHCIYSVGNALSNQRRESLNTIGNKKYTEDGMIFGVTLRKWDDGRVEICEVDILPTWVKREYVNGVMDYSIIPLDISLESWTNFGVSTPARLIESYNNTMSLVSDGLNSLRESLELEPVQTSVTADEKIK